MILIAGGEADPNIRSIAGRMAARGLDGRVLLVGAEHDPLVDWDLPSDRLTVDGEEVRPAGGFLRQDVFGAMADPRPAVAQRASAWFTAVHGWLLAHPGARILNRDAVRQINKPYHLSLAAACGLPVPHTRVTNDLAALDAEVEAGARRIAKPVAGGGYTQPLEELLETTPRRDGRAASPAIVQPRLEQPEVRIYGVGGRFIPFRVISDELDYRTTRETRVEPLPVDDVDRALVDGLARLMETLGMTFGAADFKTDPETGTLRFLEINSSPMFVAFDKASEHAVSDAILDFLVGEEE